MEPLEQPLTRTEDHRSRRDDQLVELPRRQRLPDDVGAATDGDIAVPSRLSRLGERRVKVRDEPEPGLRRRLVRGAVGEHEQRPGERVVAGAGKSVLAGVDDLLAKVADDNYRHALRDLFDGLTTIDGLTVYWGTTGCSLRVPIPNRNPLSIGWVFPPGAGRWMGLTDVTLGWDEGSAALAISDTGRAALDAYRHRLATLPGAVQAKPSLIHGFTFTPSAIIDNASVMVEAIRAVVSALTAP